jgi:hypothetical protein
VHGFPALRIQAFPHHPLQFGFFRGLSHHAKPSFSALEKAVSACIVA